MKILYFSHIDWNWIFQRPQILALQLEKNYNVEILVRRTIFTKKLISKNRQPKQLLEVKQFPRDYQVKLLDIINKKIISNSIKEWNQFEIIWLTSPYLFRYVPKNYHGKIIYDCMDYHVDMVPKRLKRVVYELEQELISRADLVFTSSRRLKQIVPNMEKSILLRNGFFSQKTNNIKEVQTKKIYTISYLGTISSWFDLDLLKDNVSKNNSIQYNLYGPIEKNIKAQELPSRIAFKGIVEHKELYKTIQDDDALIMPFQLNETVLAVDPVKLYEYICFGKCIISIYYPEIERFSPFVYFYNNVNEYNKLIEELCDKGFPPKYTKQQQEEFLKENTWEQRYGIIRKEIERLKK